MTAIRVQGCGQIDVVNDIATLQLDASVIDADAGAAFTATSQRSIAIAELLDSVGIPATDRTTSSVHLGKHIEWNGTENVDRGFIASMTIGVVVRNAATISALTAEVARQFPDTQINGPSWRVSPEHESRRTARTLAAEDARQRAEDYATALGLRITGIREVNEPAALEQPSGGGGPMMVHSMKAESSDAMPVIDGGTTLITAEVMVAFDAMRRIAV